MSAARSIQVVIPNYDDWASLGKLLPSLDRALAEKQIRARVLIVNDASPTDGSEMGVALDVGGVEAVDVLDLRRNLGHQRALAIGLAWLEAQQPGDQRPVVVMDGDGEDDPEHVPRLLAEYDRHGGSRLVFARRSRRREPLAFRLLYYCYRMLYGLLTGHELRVGNFSVLPPAALRRLVVVSELWNHYAAAVMRARIPYSEIPLDRSRRMAGKSRMNYVDLVSHGLSSISVHGETVGSRMLILTLALIAAALVGIGVVVFLKEATTLAIPGWATSATGLLAVLTLQACMLSLFFILMILAGRNAFSFIPCRDYATFVDRVRAFRGAPVPVDQPGA